MRIQRLRYCAPYRVDGGGWRSYREVGDYDDIDLRQLDGRGNRPGLQFQLRIPMRDPETGTMKDADGDPALLRIEMVGATIDYFGYGVTVKGFVSKAELMHERAYLAGDLDGCLASHDLDTEYVLEEWAELRPRKKRKTAKR